MKKCIFNLNKSNIYFKNYKIDRPVIIFTGHSRSCRFIIQYIKKFTASIDANVVLSLWDEKKDFIELLKKELNPLYIDNENFDIKLTDNIFGKKNLLDKIYKSALSTRGQVYKFCRSIEILKELEKNFKMDFGFVIKSRLDLLILKPVIFSKNKNYIFFENTFGDWGVDRSDRFFYSSKYKMYDFAGKLQTFSKKSFKNFKYVTHRYKVPINEMLFKMCCDFYKIKTKPFFPFCYIWRHNKIPTYKTFFKIFFFTLKRLIKRKVLALQA